LREKESEGGDADGETERERKRRMREMKGMRGTFGSARRMQFSICW